MQKTWVFIVPPLDAISQYGVFDRLAGVPMCPWLPQRDIDQRRSLKRLITENLAAIRHKSGIAARFLRISRWRHAKKPADADKLETMFSMLEQ